MIPIELVILGFVLAFAAGWLLRGDCDEQRKIKTRINPMYRSDWK